MILFGACAAPKEPGSGGTPLASALLIALSLVGGACRAGLEQTALLLLTDGRANVPAGQGDVRQELARLAVALQRAKVRVAVADTSRRFSSGDAASQLARVLGAEHVLLLYTDSWCENASSISNLARRLRDE